MLPWQIGWQQLGKSIQSDEFLQLFFGALTIGLLDTQQMLDTELASAL